MPNVLLDKMYVAVTTTKALRSGYIDETPEYQSRTLLNSSVVKDLRAYGYHLTTSYIAAVSDIN